MTKKVVNDIAFRTIGCAIEVHEQLGPGLLESVYQECMMEELTYQGLAFRSLDPVTLHYRGKALRNKLALDLIVENSIIVELKAVDAIAPIHKAQLLSYLKLSNMPKGY